MGWFLFFSAIVVIIFIGIKYKNLKSENEKIIVKSKQDLQECKNRTSRLLKENKNKYEAEISFLNNQINHLEVYKDMPNAEEEAKKIVENAKIEGDAIIKIAMSRKIEIEKEIEQERGKLNAAKDAFSYKFNASKASKMKEDQASQELEGMQSSTYEWGSSELTEDKPRKETRWPRDPQQPYFKITVHRRGKSREVVDFSPEPWATNRRDLCGWSWPERKKCGIYFADVISAIDMHTGEVLSRVGLWQSVLHHRDDAPPWYVRWADQHLLTLCWVMRARHEHGSFKSSMRPLVNAALQQVGYEPLDDEGFKFIIQSTKVGYNGCLTLEEQVALLSDKEQAVYRAAFKS